MARRDMNLQRSREQHDGRGDVMLSIFRQELHPLLGARHVSKTRQPFSGIAPCV
jgi:hypothetical protein